VVASRSFGGRDSGKKRGEGERGKTVLLWNIHLCI